MFFLCGGLVTVVYFARDVVSTYLGPQADAIGLHWLADQQRPLADTQQAGDTTCTLNWRRSGPGTAAYTVKCTTLDEVELHDLKVMSTDASVIDPLGSGVFFYEEQWPRSGEQIRIDRGRPFEYRGTVSLGSSFSSGNRALMVVGEVSEPGSEHNDSIRLISRELP